MVDKFHKNESQQLAQTSRVLFEVESFALNNWNETVKSNESSDDLDKKKKKSQDEVSALHQCHDYQLTRDR